MRTSEQLDKIAPALVELQANLEAVAKGSFNPHLKNNYASLDDVWAEIRPKLHAQGLAVIQYPANEGDHTIGMTTRIMHRDGQWIEDTVVIPIGQVGKGRNMAQEVGSSITYLRRYCLAAALGVVTDDDADGGQGDRAPKQAPRQRRPAPSKSGNSPPPPTEQEIFGPQAPTNGKAAYWDSLGPIERACYRSWDNVRGKLLDEDHYKVHQQVSGAIRKLFPGFEKNGYPTEASEKDGKIRVAVYRTAKAYGQIREDGFSGDEAAVLAFETAKNLAHE